LGVPQSIDPQAVLKGLEQTKERILAGSYAGSFHLTTNIGSETSYKWAFKANKRYVAYPSGWVESWDGQISRTVDPHSLLHRNVIDSKPGRYFSECPVEFAYACPWDSRIWVADLVHDGKLKVTGSEPGGEVIVSGTKTDGTQQTTFEIALDPKRGYLPVDTRITVRSAPGRGSKTPNIAVRVSGVVSAQEINGVWIPTRTALRGRWDEDFGARTGEMVVSELSDKVTDSRFTEIFRPGAQIVDSEGRWFRAQPGGRLTQFYPADDEKRKDLLIRLVVLLATAALILVVAIKLRNREVPPTSSGWAESDKERM